MAIDTQKFMDLVLYLNLLWSSPLQIILSMYFLWGILGPSSMAGIIAAVSDSLKGTLKNYNLVDIDCKKIPQLQSM